MLTTATKSSSLKEVSNQNFERFHLKPQVLFLDMNAFYASIEQQRRPYLRGKPVGIVNAESEYTQLIAASYEAKRLGVTTGARVIDAKKKIPDITIILANNKMYLEYHRRLVECIAKIQPTLKVLSVDEMAVKLPSQNMNVREIELFATALKKALSIEFGPYLTASIGVGPNIFYAKVAAEREKPDGLTNWEESELLDEFRRCTLRDLPGIGPQIEKRLRGNGITTVEKLLECPINELSHAWGGVIGKRWYLMLRGSLKADYPHLGAEQRFQSEGKGLVLPPELRTEAGVRTVVSNSIIYLLERFRKKQMAPQKIEVTCESIHGIQIFSDTCKRGSATYAESIWLPIGLRIFDTHTPFSEIPLSVHTRFSQLVPVRDRIRSLLDDDDESHERLSILKDKLNKEAPYTVEFGARYFQRDILPIRISFGAPKDMKYGVKLEPWL